jgi:hypothetical protein
MQPIGASRLMRSIQCGKSWKRGVLRRVLLPVGNLKERRMNDHPNAREEGFYWVVLGQRNLWAARCCRTAAWSAAFSSHDHVLRAACRGGVVTIGAAVGGDGHRIAPQAVLLNPRRWLDIPV